MKAKICGSLCLLSAAVLLSNAHAETPSDVLQAIPHTEELLNVVVPVFSNDLVVNLI